MFCDIYVNGLSEECFAIIVGQHSTDIKKRGILSVTGLFCCMHLIQVHMHQCKY